MKNIFKITIGLIALFLIAACNSDKEAVDTVNNNLEHNIGYSTKGSVVLDGTKVNLEPRINVIAKKNDLVTIDVFVPLAREKSSLKDAMVGGMGIFRTKYIDSDGNFRTKMKFINNDTGFTYVNTLGMKCPIIKYDEAVGTEWSFVTLGNKKLTSKIIYKSEKEDFPYGLSKIKVVKAEVNSLASIVTKYVYIANQDLGLVGIDVYLEDGTVLNVRKN